MGESEVMRLTEQLLELAVSCFSSPSLVVKFEEAKPDAADDGQDDADQEANQIDVVAHCHDLPTLITL